MINDDITSENTNTTESKTPQPNQITEYRAKHDKKYEEDLKKQEEVYKEQLKKEFCAFKFIHNLPICGTEQAFVDKIHNKDVIPLFRTLPPPQP